MQIDMHYYGVYTIVRVADHVYAAPFLILVSPMSVQDDTKSMPAT